MCRYTHVHVHICKLQIYLGIPPTGGAALDPEGRALRGLADADECLLVEVRPERLAEPDGGGGLALCVWWG